MELEPGFNYEVLNIENRLLVQQRTRELKERLQRTAQDIWEIGQKLVEVRSQLKGQGHFDAWLRGEFGWSRRTAYNFIYVYEAFPCEKFAQINIEPSALYRLASPSTPSTLRDEFIKQANTGVKVTHKEVLKAVTKEKEKQAPDPPTDKPLKSANAQPEVAAVPASLQRTAAQIQSVISEVKQPPYQPATTVKEARHHQSQWYMIGADHLLFCGDTNSREFVDRLPTAAFALDIAAGKWQHEWLMYKARSALILSPQAQIDEKLIERLLLMFSQRGEAVIFPWLPSGEIIATVNRLKRKLFAGYPERQQCERAIANSGLKAHKVELPSLD